MSITIPDSVVSIDEEAFSHCSNLARIKISTGVTSIGRSAFSNCTNLASVIIPNSVVSIGDYAFSYCAGLTNIVLSDGVETIGSQAFDHCPELANISIPASVTSIGDYVFLNCDNLEDAFFYGDAPVMKYALNGVDKNVFTIHYTAGSTGWTDSDAYDMKLGTWNGYKLALWDGQSVQIQQATPQSVTIHVQNKEEAYVYAAIYENGRFVKTVCKLVPVNAGEVTLALGMDEMPEGAVIKAFVLAADGKTPLVKNAVWTVR